MSKVKMRCNTCGKWFQSANAKDLTCPECLQKARREKTAKTTPSVSKTPAGQVSRPASPPPKPKPAQSGTNQWLDSLNDIKIGQPDQPTRPKLPIPPASRDNREASSGRGAGSSAGSTPYRDERGPGGPRPYQENRGPGNSREGGSRSLAAYRDRPAGDSALAATQRPRPPIEGGSGRSFRPGGPGESQFDKSRTSKPGPGPRGKLFKPKAKAPKPPQPPKPKREKIPPPQPFKPTPEQVTQVETRYLELAVPAEYDGIRTQIAQELGIPKTAVKRIVKDLRERQNIPSWWEVQSYKGSTEDLERIKALYEPTLPVPPIGIHKTIAEQLSLKPAMVYQAIKQIRQEMKLPQYNNPALHGLPPIQTKASEQATSTAESTPAAVTEDTGETSPAPPESVIAAEITVEQEGSSDTASVPTETTDSVGA
jgi:hypothetical protein